MMTELHTTRYLKSIKTPLDPRYKVLKPGTNNKKLGGIVTAKKWTGKRMYSLTLVERDTCPEYCHHWNDCYGNNMPFAHRFTETGLTYELFEEIESLCNKYPEGIVIRLHVLGDFYSTEYVGFWADMLDKHPNLCIFGYTARKGDNIAIAIMYLNDKYLDRCMIRYSRNREYNDIPADRYAAEESFEGESFTCPEQTGILPSCAACGACWISTKTVRFLSH
jgi:hypothetical protein